PQRVEELMRCSLVSDDLGADDAAFADRVRPAGTRADAIRAALQVGGDPHADRRHRLRLRLRERLTLPGHGRAPAPPAKRRPHRSGTGRSRPAAGTAAPDLRTATATVLTRTP